jgi:NO-binding membrane sensor protein with MHYT domain
MDWYDPRVPHLIAHAAVTLVAVALLPAVCRRFGRAYGIYTATFVLGCALSTSNFVGMGRYVLAAFPLFALAGDVLTRRSALRVAVLASSGALLIAFTQFHARNLLVS